MVSHPEPWQPPLGLWASPAWLETGPICMKDGNHWERNHWESSGRAAWPRAKPQGPVEGQLGILQHTCLLASPLSPAMEDVQFWEQET